MKTFIQREILLSIKQDYNPDMSDPPNTGVVAVVDNIQTDVSSIFLSSFIQPNKNIGVLPVSCFCTDLKILL